MKASLRQSRGPIGGEESLVNQVSALVELLLKLVIAVAKDGLSLRSKPGSFDQIAARVINIGPSVEAVLVPSGLAVDAKKLLLDHVSERVVFPDVFMKAFLIQSWLAIDIEMSRLELVPTVVIKPRGP